MRTMDDNGNEGTAVAAADDSVEMDQDEEGDEMDEMVRRKNQVNASKSAAKEDPFNDDDQTEMPQQEGNEEEEEKEEGGEAFQDDEDNNNVNPAEANEEEVANGNDSFEVIYREISH